MEKQQRSMSTQEALARQSTPAVKPSSMDKVQVFRRKIDCGSSTETSAERMILRDPNHILRNHRGSGRRSSR